METIKPKPLSSLIFIPLLALIFIRPFFSGLAYPVFEFYYEICVISLAIIILLTPSPFPLPKGERIFSLFSPLPLGERVRVRGSYNLPIFLLLSAYIISTITSVNTQNSITETIKFISYLSIFLIVSKVDEKQKNTIIKTLVIAGLIISLYSIYQYFFGYQNTLDYLKKINSPILLNSSYAKDILISKRSIGTFPSPNILAGYLLLILFLALLLFERSREQSAIKPQSLYIILILFALILTKSLGAWLSLVATLFILLFFKLAKQALQLQGKKCSRKACFAFYNFPYSKLILILSLGFVASVLIFILTTRCDRLTNLQNPQNSITQRLNYWHTAIAVIKSHPIVGIGPGNFQEVFLKYKVGLSTNTRYAHNIFLHQWLETGILGFIGIGLLITLLIKKYIQKPNYISLAGIGFILHNLIDNTYFIPEAGLLWWVIIAFALY